MLCLRPGCGPRIDYTNIIVFVIKLSCYGVYYNEQSPNDAHLTGTAAGMAARRSAGMRSVHRSVHVWLAPCAGGQIHTRAFGSMCMSVRQSVRAVVRVQRAHSGACIHLCFNLLSCSLFIYFYSDRCVASLSSRNMIFVD